MAIFLDTGFFFALLSKKDKFHKRAQDLLIQLSEGNFGHIFTSDFIMDESMTLLNIRTRGARKDLLKKMKTLFLGLEPIAILLKVNNAWLEEISQIQVKFSDINDPISFTDASNIHICNNFKILNIISFDAHYTGILNKIQ